MALSIFPARGAIKGVRKAMLGTLFRHLTHHASGLGPFKMLRVEEGDVLLVWGRGYEAIVDYTIPYANASLTPCYVTRKILQYIHGRDWLKIFPLYSPIEGIACFVAVIFMLEPFRMPYDEIFREILHFVVTSGEKLYLAFAPPP